MKKQLLLLALMAGGITAHADDSTYPYLTFETTDGTKTSVSVSSLEISVSGTTLTAGDNSFVIANLSKMYFSSTDQTTGITAISQVEWEEATEVYDLNGRRVAKEKALKGAFIVKGKNGTCIITVR